MAEAIQVNWQHANYNGQFHNRSFSFIKIKPHFNGLLFFRARSEQQYNLFYSKLSAATPDSFLPSLTGIWTQQCAPICYHVFSRDPNLSGLLVMSSSPFLFSAPSRSSDPLWVSEGGPLSYLLAICWPPISSISFGKNHFSCRRITDMTKCMF